jgi:hypothetical protein
LSPLFYSQFGACSLPRLIAPDIALIEMTDIVSANPQPERERLAGLRLLRGKSNGNEKR